MIETGGQIGGEGKEMRQEFHHAPGFSVDDLVGLDFGQQRPGQNGQDGQFIIERGVEHRIRFFLEGEDPGAFAPADVGPHLERACGGMAPIAMVAHQTADQPVVGGRNAVVVVQVQLGQRGNINQNLRASGRPGVSAGFREWMPSRITTWSSASCSVLPLWIRDPV